MVSEETRQALAAQRQQMQASLAEVIRQAKAEAWDEGRASVGEQMLQPRDEYGMFPPVTNPYRGGQ